MKSVLISIQPKWCELIASGKKTVEVRKTKPKLEVPFKVYIYCTQNTPYNPVIPMRYEKEGGNIYIGGKRYAEFLTSKVIGEFVCDKITPLFNVATTSWNLLAGNIHEYAKGLVKMAHLSEEEIHGYAKGKNCYAWHISDLVIYDTPKELSEFYRECEEYKCEDCPRLYVENTPNCYETWCEVDGKIPIKRPPQSWGYCEELKGE